MRLRRASDVPQTCPKRTQSASSPRRASGELRASDAVPTDPTRFRRSPFGAPGQGPGAPGKVRRGLAQSRSCDRPRSHGRWRRGEAEPGRRGAGSGRGPTKRKGGKQDPAEVRQRAQASSAVSPRKSRKPATPQALKPQVPQPRKSRNPPQVPQDQQPHKPPQSRNPLNPRSSRKSCKPLAKSFCAF